LSGQEDRAADLVESTLREWVFAPSRKGNNVWCEIGTTGPRLLMVSHLDTVKPCEGWEADPHDVVWRNDRLVGLGANDAKGCASAMLGAFRKLGARGRVCLLLVAEEETGGQGGINSVLPDLGAFDAAIVGEPTGLHVCTAQRGMLLFKCTARGVSGHTAHAKNADNAIHKAARDITRLAEMSFPVDAVLGECKAQVTTIQGGLLRNQVPDKCEFYVDLRTTPSLIHKVVVKQLTDALESEVDPYSERYLPKATSPEQAIVKAALQASQHKEPVGSATVSDWAFLGDIPAVKVGPGDTLRSHKPNEFLTLQELEDGVEFYERCVNAYFEEMNHA
jgi:acetylornithine deacetylase